MFEWFDELVASIRWRGFFTFDGPLTLEELADLHDCQPPLPPPYVTSLVTSAEA